MQLRNIRVGMKLRLKRERQEAYGMTDPVVEVLRIHPRPGYLVPWIVGDGMWTDMDGTVHPFGFYKPSDFSRAIV